MGRPRGSRNPDFETTRDAMLRALSARVLSPGGAQASFRELAAAVDTSVPTLRHYFGTREQVLQAVFAHIGAEGAGYVDIVAHGPLGALRESISWFVGFVVSGLEHGLLEVHAAGLAAGLGDAQLGPSYLSELLEPTLQALEARLDRHVAAGQMRPCDTRHAALMLLSPLLLAVVHQRALFGARCRPLDVQALADAHVEAFVRAFEPRAE